MIFSARYAAHVAIEGRERRVMPLGVDRLHPETVISSCKPRAVALIGHCSRDPHERSNEPDGVARIERYRSRIRRIDRSAARHVLRRSGNRRQHLRRQTARAKTVFDEELAQIPIIIVLVGEADAHQADADVL